MRFAGCGSEDLPQLFSFGDIPFGFFQPNVQHERACLYGLRDKALPFHGSFTVQPKSLARGCLFVRLTQVLMDKGDSHAAFAHTGSDALDGTGANVAGR